MNGFVHQVTSHALWPILPIGILGATWLGLSLRMSMGDAAEAKRTLGRGLSRFTAIPETELDNAIEIAKRRIMALGILPALVVAASYMAMMVAGKEIHDANVSSAARLALYAVVVAAGGLGIPTFINWFIRTLLARSLDRRFADRIEK